MTFLFVVREVDFGSTFTVSSLPSCRQGRGVVLLPDARVLSGGVTGRGLQPANAVTRGRRPATGDSQVATAGYGTTNALRSGRLANFCFYSQSQYAFRSAFPTELLLQQRVHLSRCLLGEAGDVHPLLHYQIPLLVDRFPDSLVLLGVIEPDRGTSESS